MSHNIKLGSKQTLASKLSQNAKRFKESKNKNLKKSASDSFCESDDTSNMVQENDSTNNSFSYIEGNVSLKLTSILPESYFYKPCITLAKHLLGKSLVRKLDSGEILKGKIVETECYLGVEDKASHSYLGKRTERNEAMFLPPGTAYVYSIYGMYYCFNISSLEEGSAVLIRALEPLQGASTMLTLRSLKRKNVSSLKDKDLCNGPSKLCQAFKIEKQLLNKVKLCNSSCLWVEDGMHVLDCDIIACKRIGIDSAGEEWANKPLRFYIKDCLWVSVRNKSAESGN